MVFHSDYFRRYLLAIPLILIFSCFSNAQVSMNGSGNTITGQGGTVSYSVGQPYIINTSGTAGHSNGGIQQAFFVYTIGIPDPIVPEVDVLVFPNPAITSVNILFNERKTGNWEYTLSGTNGSQMSHQIIEGDREEISFRDFSAGVYFLDIHYNGQLARSFKIMKQ